jgi:hypothetical protein
MMHNPNDTHETRATGGHDDCEGRNLSPEVPSPKAFGSVVPDAHLPKCVFSKTNPSIWLVDYHLACEAGVANDDLFIIQCLLIYLAASERYSPTTFRARTCVLETLWI